MQKPPDPLRQGTPITKVSLLLLESIFKIAVELDIRECLVGEVGGVSVVGFEFLESQFADPFTT